MAGDLERLLDGRGVVGALEALAEVCRAKAEHLRVNWQDEAGAKGWDRDAGGIEALAGRMTDGSEPVAGACPGCGEDYDSDCKGEPRCSGCDGPCPCCDDGGLFE